MVGAADAAEVADPGGEVGAVVGGLCEVIDVAVEEALEAWDGVELGELEGGAFAVVGGGERDGGAVAEGAVEVPLHDADALVAGANVVAEVVLVEAAVGVVGAVEGHEGEGAHPLVDVDEWIEGVGEGIAAELEGLVDGDDAGVVVAGAGAADLEAPAVGLFGVAAVEEVVAAFGVGAWPGDFEAFGAAGAGGGRVVELEIVDGAFGGRRHRGSYRRIGWCCAPCGGARHRCRWGSVGWTRATSS